MKDEIVESFEWLFNYFLDAMGGVPSNTIITDKDQAMATTSQRCFPIQFTETIGGTLLTKCRVL
jgi:hypothetical protein